MYYKKMEPLSKKSNKASGKSTATENTELTQRENSVVTQRENSVVTQRENSVVTQRENTGVTLWENTGVTQRENTGMTQRENTGVTQRENLNDIAEGTSVKQGINCSRWDSDIYLNIFPLLNPLLIASDLNPKSASWHCF